MIFELRFIDQLIPFRMMATVFLLKMLRFFTLLMQIHFLSKKLDANFNEWTSLIQWIDSANSLLKMGGTKKVSVAMVSTKNNLVAFVSFVEK